MNLGWLFFISRRYFKTKRRDKGLASSLLSVLGISVGVMILTAVLAVMNGFQLSFIENILEISSSHLRLESPTGAPLTAEQEKSIRALPEVGSLLPFLDSQTMIKGPYSSLRPAFVRGVAPDAPEFDPGLKAHAKIIDGAWDLSGGNRIILGSEMARALGVQSGDLVKLMALSGQSFSLLKPQEVDFQVAGIFKSGYYDFDSSWAFISLDRSSDYFSRPSDLVYGVKLKDYFQDQQAMAKISSFLGGTDRQIVSWRDYNSAFFGALRMEKMTMMFLIGLIFLVVGVNIYHSLKRSVMERREDIGLLKAIGAPPSSVRSIFLFEGLFIGFLGAVIGLIAGLFVSININQIFSLIELVINTVLTWVQQISGSGGDTTVALYSGNLFYIPRIPSRVLFPETVIIFLFAVFSAAGASWLASRKITTIKPAAVLRAE